ncbi:MAG: glycosyltransferase family 2 protein [Geobacteraceae bacterium]|nr:glycosyltransferase family 2 protein [Geobacteraceae bacterium]
MNRVYIVIVNWNGWKDTIECLESLLILEYPDFRIVVCDNGSQDDSVTMLRAWCERRFGFRSADWQVLSRQAAEKGEGSLNAVITLVTNGANLGFGGGTNVGLRYALACGDAAYCWLLNNDTVADTLALTELVARLNEKPDACMCGSTVREYGNRSRIQALGGAIYYKWLGIAWHIGRTLQGDVLPEAAAVENKMDYVTGASLLVQSSYLTEVGLLAEDYFLYFEEIDWVSRGLGRYTLAYAPKSVVYHKVGASIGTATNPLRKSYLCDYYSLRNRILYSRRHCPSVLPCVYLGLVVELFVRLLLGRWDLAGMVWRLLRNSGEEAKTS